VTGCYTQDKGAGAVMSVGCQITDGCGLCTASRSPLHRLHCG